MRFIWPLADHYITRGFDFVADIYVEGDNGVRLHAAIDLVRLQGGTLGRDILAVADGIVAGDAWDKYSGYYIVVEHEGGWRSTYRHLISDAPPVVGHPMMQGQVIGYVGSTGLSSGPHLHFDLWHSRPQDPTAHAKVGWWAHDPELYLGKEDDMTDEQMARLKEIADGHATYTQNLIREQTALLLERMEVLAVHADGRRDGHASYTQGKVREIRDEIMTKLDTLQLNSGRLTQEGLKEAIRQVFQEVWGS